MTGAAAGLLIKKLSMKYDWLNIRNKKLGCMLCQKIGTLGVDKKIGLKFSIEWANSEIIYFWHISTATAYVLMKEILSITRKPWGINCIKISCRRSSRDP
jgi:hypothetical protein